MPLITLDNISLRFSEKIILDEINATILKGDKIGLIGRNGEGKSSFLKVLAGYINADDGNLKVKNNTRISYLEQQPPEDNDYFLFSIVAQGLGEVGDLLASYHESLQNGDNNDIILNSYLLSNNNVAYEQVGIMLRASANQAVSVQVNTGSITLINQ